MNKHLKIIVLILAIVIVGTGISIPILASVQDTEVQNEQLPAEGNQEFAENADVAESTVSIVAAESQTKSSKSLTAALVVGVAAAAGAISMGLAIGKSVESTARQPEAGGKIQTMLMLGLVFIETAIIYALIVAILIIFVL